MTGYLQLPNGTTVDVRDGLLLGRVAPCDVVVDDTKASRRHARLHVEAGVAEIEDLQSSNGTLLNDKPVERRMLRDGDRIRIGKTEIVYRERGGSGGVRGGAESLGGVDLFADADDAMAAAPPPPPPPPPARPKPIPTSTPAPTPPPPREPALDVIEFADDEVVEVRAPAATTRSRGGSTGAGAGTERPTPGRVLQFSANARRDADATLLGDDLRQMSGPLRAALILVAVAAAAGLFFLAMKLAG
jgi:predicted component of type VI protein secretion system